MSYVFGPLLMLLRGPVGTDGGERRGGGPERRPPREGVSR